jgi:threonine/homoserine/homoserine lactone efflux protein
MGEAIGAVLPVALGVALSPIPVVAVILMLFTARARRNSVAFLAGWAVGLLVVGGLALALAGSAGLFTDDTGRSVVAGVLRLLLAVVLVLLGVRAWRNRPVGDQEPSTPGWMAAIDGFTAPRSFGLAAVLSGVNPKNLALNLAAMATIAGIDLPAGDQVTVLVVFVLLASVTVGAPVAIHLAAGTRARPTLESWKEWLIRNNSTVMATLLLVLGVKLAGDAIAIFAAS